MDKKYDMIQVDFYNVYRMLQRTNKRIPQEGNEALDAPVTMDELHIPVKQGQNTKHTATMG